jgi:hypothetical protein
VVFNLFIAIQFLYLWISPDVNDIHKIQNLSILIVFEFIMVHSGVFMAVMPLKFSLFVFFPFYGLFAWGFNTIVSDNSIVMLYLLTVFNRMRFAFFNIDKQMQAELMLKSFYTLGIYFTTIMVVVISAQIIPKFGLTEAFLEKATYSKIKQGSGLMIDSPNVSMCLGCIYFILLSLLEIKLIYSKGKPLNWFSKQRIKIAR